MHKLLCFMCWKQQYDIWHNFWDTNGTVSYFFCPSRLHMMGYTVLTGVRCASRSNPNQRLSRPQPRQPIMDYYRLQACFHGNWQHFGNNIYYHWFAQISLSIQHRNFQFPPKCCTSNMLVWYDKLSPIPSNWYTNFANYMSIFCLNFHILSSLL